MFKDLHRWLTRRVFYPLNNRQKGLSRAELKRWQERDGFTPEQVQALQRERLRELLVYAEAHCRFYRQRFAEHRVQAQAADPLAEVRKLPALTKADVRDNLQEMFSDEFGQRDGLVKKATGGSTGRPLEVWGDQEDYRLNGLVIARQRRWIGWEGGMETVTIFGGVRDLPSALKCTAKRWLINDRLINNMAREQGDYDRLAGQLLSSPPEAIIAYFSSLRELAAALERRNQRLAGVKVAIACAEPLEERGRRHAERWLGTKVYFQYGCRELGGLAQECPQQQGYHYAQDIALCEVLDEAGHPADYGQLTITYFGNRVVPLIRYQIGDAAALDTSRCGCGLPWHRLKVIEGRLSSMIQTPGGERLSSIIFPHLFKDYPWILEYQAEQAAADRIILRIRREEKSFSESSKEELENKLLGLMGGDMRLDWRFEEPFVGVATGKHVYFIELKAQSSKLKTQSSKLKAQSRKLEPET